MSPKARNGYAEALQGREGQVCEMRHARREAGLIERAGALLFSASASATCI